MRDSIQDPRPNQTHRAIIVATAVILLVLGSLYSIPALHAVDNTTSVGTVPPPYGEPITVTVSPASDVSPAGKITYTITLLKFQTDYPVSLGVTSTVPISLTVLPASLFATKEPMPTLQEGSVIWRGEFAPLEVASTVTISYVVQAPECNGVPARTLTGTVSLQEIPNPERPDPTQPLIATSEVTLEGCIAYLPSIEKAPPFPTLANGNLNQGPTVGWGQEPFPLIYAKSAIPLVVQTGAGSEYVAWLGGSSNMTNTLTQTVTIPAVYQAKLKYRYYTASQEAQKGSDTAIVWVVSESGTDKLAEYPLSVNEDTNAWKQELIDLKDYSGKTIELRFQSVLNGARNSNWFLNNFELCQVGKGC